MHVPFKGAAPAITCAIRDDTAPDVPTASEQNMPVVIGGWHILATPKGTPPSVVEQLNAALNNVTGNPEFCDKLIKRGVQPATSPPDEAQATVDAEWQRWGAIAKKAEIRAED